MNNIKKYILLILGVWVFVTLNAIWLCGSINAATWNDASKGAYVAALLWTIMLSSMTLNTKN